MKDFFDQEYVEKCYHKYKYKIEKQLDKMVFSEDSKRKLIDLDTTRILFVSPHKSHVDYCLHPLVLLRAFPEQKFFPRIVAGVNLLEGYMGRLIQALIGINFHKAGAIPVERNGNSSREILQKIASYLKEETPVLLFPEFDKETNKAGRSYDGKIKNFSPLLLKSAKIAAKEGNEVYIVPAVVSYDFVPEDKLFPRLITADIMRNSRNKSRKILGNMYYALIESFFFTTKFSLMQGNAYVDIGEPLLVTPQDNLRTLASKAQEECEKAYRVSSTALISRALTRGKYSVDEILDSVKHDINYLNGKDIQFSNLSIDLEYSVQTTLENMMLRNIVVSDNDEILSKSNIVKYYANTIEHHWRR